MNFAEKKRRWGGNWDHSCLLLSQFPYKQVVLQHFKCILTWPWGSGALKWEIRSGGPVIPRQLSWTSLAGLALCPRHLLSLAVYPWVLHLLYATCVHEISVPKGSDTGNQGTVSLSHTKSVCLFFFWKMYIGKHSPGEPDHLCGPWVIRNMNFPFCQSTL